jgi:hypothetical protein
VRPDSITLEMTEHFRIPLAAVLKISGISLVSAFNQVPLLLVGSRIRPTQGGNALDRMPVAHAPCFVG